MAKRINTAPMNPRADGKAVKFPYGQQVHTDARFTSFFLIIPIVKIPAPKYRKKATMANAPPQTNKILHCAGKEANATGIRMLVQASTRYAPPKSFKNRSGKVRQLAPVLIANAMAPPMPETNPKMNAIEIVVPEYKKNALLISDTSTKKKEILVFSTNAICKWRQYRQDG
jgi:hypothetical protein